MSNTDIIHQENGTKSWWLQRKTAIILIPLMLWFCWMMISFLFDRELITNCLLYSPLKFLFFLILINISIFHGMLGMKEICEDYIHKDCMCIATIFVIECIGWLTMIASSLMLMLNFIVNI